MGRLVNGIAKMRYMLLQDISQFGLQEQVNEIISLGFVPVGGLVIDGSGNYYQSVWQPSVSGQEDSP